MHVKHGKEQNKMKKNSSLGRKICGPVYNVGSGVFERRRNDKLQRYYSHQSICQFICRIEWVGVAHKEGYGGEPNCGEETCLK